MYIQINSPDYIIKLQIVEKSVMTRKSYGCFFNGSTIGNSGGYCSFN